MNIRFFAAARADIRDAFDYYQAQSPGLGVRFSQELAAAVRNIAAHPRSRAVGWKKTRKFNLKHFPFGVVYLIDAGTIHVAGVIDLRRKPGYWKDRLR